MKTSSKSRLFHKLIRVSTFFKIGQMRLLFKSFWSDHFDWLIMGLITLSRFILSENFFEFQECYPRVSKWNINRKNLEFSFWNPYLNPKWSSKWMIQKYGSGPSTFIEKDHPGLTKLILAKFPRLWPSTFNHQDRLLSMARFKIV